MRVTQGSGFVNAYEGEEFDPDAIEYYGDFGDDEATAGIYTVTRERKIFAAGPVLHPKAVLLQGKQVDSTAFHSDRKRFANRTRMAPQFVGGASVAEGTPKG
jgi:hypothetical protein